MRISNSKIKIIFIQPITIFTTSFDFKNTVVTHLLEIATSTKIRLRNRSNVEVEVINLIDEEIYKPISMSELNQHISSLELFFERFNDGSDLVFGISCFSSNYYISTLVLAGVLRKMFSHCLICVGGYQVNYFSEEFQFPGYIRDQYIPNKLFDFIFLGECSVRFSEFIDYRIDRGSIYSNIQESCQVIDCGLVTDLEQLPLLDYSLIDHDKFTQLYVPIYFSRGCPFNCSYCGDFRNIYLPKVRWRWISPSNAYSRIKNLLNYYSEKNIQIQIFDPLWTYPSWRMKFYDFLIENEISEEMWAEVRVDQFSLKEITLLKKLNFTLAFGLESGSYEMLRIMKKTSNPKKFLDKFQTIITKLNSVGRYAIMNILFGHPGEDMSTMTQTIEYINKITQNVENLIPSISKYMIIPGSDIFNNLNYYIKTYQAKFHYPNHWTIPKCSYLSSSMVDPSKHLGYIDIIKFLSNWIPDLYKKCIQNFSRMKNRGFIYQRYINGMIFGPRTYWKDNPLRHYNDFGDKFDTINMTRDFWQNFTKLI